MSGCGGGDVGVWGWGCGCGCGVWVWGCGGGDVGIGTVNTVGIGNTVSYALFHQYATVCQFSASSHVPM